MQRLLSAYDRLFGTPMPYVMGVHQSPAAPAGKDLHLHFHFYPARRSADKLKHLAGSELAAGAYLVDVSPEAAAKRLRELI